eukprot:Selendium_serpulae@DN7018_c0_g1_i1.p1
MSSANNLGFRKLQFWGAGSSTAFSEQLHQAAQCSLLIGMHGAGMHVAVGMERPAVLRLLKNHIGNKNEQNVMTLIGGCYAEAKLSSQRRSSSSPRMGEKRPLAREGRHVKGTYADPQQVWDAAIKALKGCGIWDDNQTTSQPPDNQTTRHVDNQNQTARQPDNHQTGNQTTRQPPDRQPDNQTTTRQATR